jgi:VanZ family protein
VDSRLAIAAIGVVAIIAYGSLFPFDFHSLEIPEGPWNALLSTWQFPADRPDNVSNFVLYLPLGFLLVRAWRAGPRWASVPLAAAAGIALSMCMEMAQLYDDGRVTQMGDVYANGAGALAGAIAAAILRRDLEPGARVRMLTLEITWRPFAALLMICWLANRLFPYFPAIGFHVSDFHAAFTAPGLLEVFKQTAFWLALGVLLESMLGVGRSRAVLALIIAVVLIARVFVIDGPISATETGGAVLAALAWLALSRAAHSRIIVAALFVALVILETLAPFHFSASPRTFGWIPFASFIAGPRESGVRVFFEKAFTYGALVWLPVRAGTSFAAAAIFGVALEFALRQAQVFLPGRSAEITDAVMVLMLAALMKLVREPLP